MKIGDVIRIGFNDGQQAIGLYNGEDDKHYYITMYFTNLFRKRDGIPSGQKYRKDKVKIKAEYI